VLKVGISERLLSFFVSRDRAAAIVGDLLELHCGRLEFWLAVSRTTWTLSWRLGLGFLLAAAAELYAFFVVNNWAARPPHGVDGTAIFSGWCFALFGAGAVFSIIRFGVFDAISRLPIVLAVLTGLDAFFWWMPLMRLTSVATAVLVVVLSCLTRQGRLALRRLIGAMLAAAAPLITMLYLGTKATAEQCRQGCALNFHNAPVLLLVPLAFFLSSGIVAGMLGRHKEGRAEFA
jgi:hypothetical protein